MRTAAFFQLISLFFLGGCLPTNSLVLPLSNESLDHRPLIHFSVSKNWMGNPSAAVYYDGELHLFYLYNPDGLSPKGPMHWGHAVKTKGNWTEMPTAISADELGEIWSGSVVVDTKNVTGFQTQRNISTLVAFYTSAGDTQQQSMAYSNDKGTTFVKYDQNPIIKNPGLDIFRDPKVVPYKDFWIMLLSAGDRIQFYKSNNLITWTYLSDFRASSEQNSYVWERPDLIILDYEGWIRWTLLVSVNAGGPNGISGTQYFIGYFDGTTYTNSFESNRINWLDFGPDNSGGTTVSNHPAGKYEYISWMNNQDYAEKLPTGNWRGQITSSRMLHLGSVPNSVSPFIELHPSGEEYVYDIDACVYEDESRVDIRPGSPLKFDDVLRKWNFNPLLQVEFEFRLEEFGETSTLLICFMNEIEQEVCAGLQNQKYGYNRTVFMDRSKSGNIGFSEKFLLRSLANIILYNEPEYFPFAITALLDVSSLEVYFGSGVSLTSLFFPNQPLSRIEIRHEINGNYRSILKVEKQKIYSLNYCAI